MFFFFSTLFVTLALIQIPLIEAANKDRNITLET